jgi:hypothetical protein
MHKARIEERNAPVVGVAVITPLWLVIALILGFSTH